MKPSFEPVRIVVTDAGPLIALAKSGYLHLLPALFGEILIPLSVKNELRLEEERPGTALLGRSIQGNPAYRIVAAQSIPEELAELLDPGESEAIALAEENKCLLLIDERKGRGVARKRGISFVGTGGLLVAAKKYGHIDHVAEVLENLRRCGYRLADALCVEILRMAGE